VNRIAKLLPHVCLILAGMFITFFIIDRLNGAMSVLGTNTAAKVLLFLFSIVSVIVSAMLIHRQRNEG
jgi:membrane protein implicated in regulation of membrane protease activity